MIQKPLPQLIICFVGLGYVGTPLAEAFAKYLPTIGYDNDRKKTELLTVRSCQVSMEKVLIFYARHMDWSRRYTGLLISGPLKRQRLSRTYSGI